jgi:stearoyl-CoA desaturase (delta-9 desaturase)
MAHDARDSFDGSCESSSTSVADDDDWLYRRIGTPDRPATMDRFMDWKRFTVACVYRGGSDPWPIKVPLPVVLSSFHAATLYAAASLVGDSPPSAALLGGSLGMYSLLTFGISAGHHRYFSHRSYKTSRPFQFALATVGCLAWQRGPIWWSSHHNYHHQHSDTAVDPHSPLTGSFWWSHMGWYWASSQYDAPLDRYSRTWRTFPELALLDKLHFLPGLALLSSLYAAGGAEAALWGFVVPVVGCWNAIFAIGSICHGELGGGSRPFQRTGAADRSTNVPWVALLTFGDGWHNNQCVARPPAAGAPRLW